MIQKRYTVVSTGFGNVYITADAKTILRIDCRRPHVCAAMRQDSMPLLSAQAKALVLYLQGEITALPPPDTTRFSPFQQAVYRAICRIPYGQSVTSLQLARNIGIPHAVKAIETMCRNNPLCIAVPTHRVVLSDSKALSPSNPLLFDEALRRLEKRYLDKAAKRR